MIAFWISLALPVRFAILVVAGLIGGALANHVITTFAYFYPRPISPWGKGPEGGPPRRAADRIPVLGWFGLRRERSIHGTGFWIRPLLIELSMAAAIPILYHLETQTGWLLPTELAVPRVLPIFEPVATWIFLAHAILLTLMVAATFIDFDEKTIPDIITIPGTLVGLILGATSISIFMPTEIDVPNVGLTVAPTTFDSPWYAMPNQWMNRSGVLMGLMIWAAWCFALMDRRWSGALARRRGLGRAIEHLIAGMFRYGFWKVLAAIWISGSIAIIAVWNGGGNHWLGLFTSLVGLAVGGGVIWAIRIVASGALNVEAMGFGDVTLMAMIGAFIGWQAVIVAFIYAILSACVISVVVWIFTRDPQLPFGPYLCCGTVLTVLVWDGSYNEYLSFNLAIMGDVLLWISIMFLVLMGVMLAVWRQIKMRLIYRD